MRYEIINPSDACSVEADSPEIAAAAVLVLGGGVYGCQDESGRRLPTMFLIGGREAADKAWEHEFGFSLAAFFKRDGWKPSVAKCLGTFRYAGKRTSLNNIGKHAAELCARLCAQDGGR